MSQTIIVRLNGREYNIELDGRRSIVNGREVEFESVLVDNRGGIVVQSAHRQFGAVLDMADDEIRVRFRGHELVVEYETERQQLLRKFAALGAKSHHHADIKASMPGLVVRVNCEAGAEIKKGQAIIILEAMKMENEIRSPVDGILKEVRVKQGQAVEKGDLLVILD